MLDALITIVAATEGGDEKSKTPFYVAGIVLVVFALAVSALGITRHETFPPTKGLQRAVMGLAIVLVATTMASAVLTG